MPPGQSFEMTQEKPVLLILKLRRANNFVINVIVYSEYDSEVEMLNNRKVICHEYTFKKHAKSKRNLPTLPSYAQTGYYVVNLDMSQQPGSHWIAIKISKSKCKNEYFDSYGLGLSTVHFKRFMKYNYIYNSKRLQHSLSTTCA